MLSWFAITYNTARLGFIDDARHGRARSLLASLNILIQIEGGSEFSEEQS